MSGGFNVLSQENQDKFTKLFSVLGEQTKDTFQAILYTRKALDITKKAPERFRDFISYDQFMKALESSNDAATKLNPDGTPKTSDELFNFMMSQTSIPTKTQYPWYMDMIGSFEKSKSVSIPADAGQGKTETMKAVFTLFSECFGIGNLEERTILITPLQEDTDISVKTVRVPDLQCLLVSPDGESKMFVTEREFRNEAQPTEQIYQASH